MITIVDNGDGSFLYTEDEQVYYVQNSNVNSVEVVNTGVVFTMKSGQIFRIDDYTLVSGAGSPQDIVDQIESIINNSPCAPITLGDFVGDQPIIGAAVTNHGAFITGGVGPFTLNTTGTLPPGATGVEAIEASPGVWAWQFTGTTFTTFGTSTFIISGADANGCAVTPKEYTVRVGKQFVMSGFPTIPSGVPAIIATIPVDIIGTIGTDVNVYVSSITALVTDSHNLTFGLHAPNGESASFFGAGDTSGEDVIGANFFNDVAYPSVSTGTAPYTGDWFAEYGNIFGSESNGDWFIMAGIQTDPEGTLVSFTFTLIPI